MLLSLAAGNGERKIAVLIKAYDPVHEVNEAVARRRANLSVRNEKSERGDEREKERQRRTATWHVERKTGLYVCCGLRRV